MELTKKGFNKIFLTPTVISFFLIASQVSSAIATTYSRTTSCKLFFDPNLMTSQHDHAISTMVIDLAQVTANSQVDKVVRSYFEFVETVYRTRLEKFSLMKNDTETQKIIDQKKIIEKDLEKRSILILNVPAIFDPLSPEFYGGIRIALARNPTEKLPFQYEFPNYKRPNENAVSIEIGRLTSAAQVDSSIAIKLIKLAIQVATQNSNVRHIYVHTSKTHLRLYRRTGLEPTSIFIADDINYILRFTIADAVLWLATGKTVNATYY